MENFEILNTQQLLEVKGGHNELTQKDIVEEAIV
ncbi:bacteriocin class II family protein [Ancylomarina euxinus]|nr:bacteriocin class II family protein [Ancylomarina euxinus]MCZ4693674.1 bacteriocin class II family protein [Ancylomarina euxinus]